MAGSKEDSGGPFSKREASLAESSNAAVIQMRNEGSQSVSLILVYLVVKTRFQFTHNIYVMLGSFRQKWRWWVKLKPPRLASPWSLPREGCCSDAALRLGQLGGPSVSQAGGVAVGVSGVI